MNLDLSCMIGSTKKDKLGLLSLNPAAMDLLRVNPKRINWHCLSVNPAAIDLLKKNTKKISWDLLSRNPAIFEPDSHIAKIIMEL